MPFEKGHKQQIRQKPVADALRRAIAQDDAKRLREAVEQLLDKAAAGDLQAFKEIADRLDGKSVSTVEVTDNRNVSELTTNELLALVSAERAAETQTGTGEPDSIH